MGAARIGRRPRPQAAADADSASLFSPQRWRELAAFLRLTPRQLAVARLLCADFSNAEIAQRLGLSNDTVGTHLKALYRRLDVQSRVGVVVRLVLVERKLDQQSATRPAADTTSPLGGGTAAAGLPRESPDFTRTCELQGRWQER